jgi:hypothetical protein
MSKHDISADYDTLLRQSKMTAEDYFIRAISEIDKQFGDGYAESNPDLVIAFMRSSSNDFNYAMVKLAAQDIRDGMQYLADVISEAKE